MGCAEGGQGGVGVCGVIRYTKTIDQFTLQVSDCCIITEISVLSDHFHRPGLILSVTVCLPFWYRTVLDSNDNVLPGVPHRGAPIVVYPVIEGGLPPYGNDETPIVTPENTRI